MNSLELYRQLYLIRACEEALMREYPHDEIRTPLHQSMGAEAIAVGICSNLRPDDQVLTSYRSHAVFLAKTGNVRQFFGEMYGRTTGTSRGRAGSMHLADPEHGHVLATAVVASQLPVAVGLAWANKRARNGRVVAVFFGDGAMDEGVFWESLNLAALWRLPILFVCEDNGLSVQTPLEQRSGMIPYYRTCPPFWVDSERITTDWVDVERVTAGAKKMIDTVRTGHPGFLTIPYYRRLEHVGVALDYDQGYRPDPGPDWPDPVAFQQRRLISSGLGQQVAGLELQIHQQVAEAVSQARQAPLDSDIWTGVYATT